MIDTLIQKIPLQDVRNTILLKKLFRVEASELEKKDASVVSDFEWKLQENKTLYLDDLTPERCTYKNHQFMIKKAVSMLARKEEIVHVILSNSTIACTLDVLNAAIKNPYVRTISLQQIAFSIAGIRQFAAIMKQMPQLISFELKEIQIISETGAEMLAEYSGYQELFQLLFVDFSKTFPNLRCLKLSQITFSNTSGQRFFDSLSKLPLLSLNLTDCKMAKDNLTILCRLIQQNMGLKDLTLKNLRPLGSDFIKHPSWPEAIASKNYLFLQNNFFEPAIEALAYATALEYLDFSSNELQGRTIEKLAQIINIMRLETLIMRGNQMTTNDFVLLKNALHGAATLVADPPVSFPLLADAGLPVVSTSATKHHSEFIRQPQPFNCFSFDPHHDFHSITKAFSSILMEAIHKDRDTYELYMLFSRCLTDFYIGAASVASGLVEPSVRNTAVWGTDQIFEATLTIGFFSAATSLVVPVSIMLISVRETITLIAQAKSKEECRRLLSLIEPKNADYLQTILPAMVAMILTYQKKPFDKVQFMGKVFTSWKKAALLNNQCNNHLAQRPMLWVMHILLDLFEASSPAHVNSMVLKAWSSMTQTLPTPSMLARKLRDMQTLEEQLTQLTRVVEEQQRQIAEQNKKINDLNSWKKERYSRYVFDVPEPYYCQSTVIGDDEWEEPVYRKKHQIQEQFLDSIGSDDEDEGFSLRTM